MSNTQDELEEELADLYEHAFMTGVLDEREELKAKEHNYLKAQEAKQRITNLINEARLDGAEKLHRRIFDEFNMLERIQPYYKGYRSIDVRVLQGTICDYLAQLEQETKHE